MGALSPEEGSVMTNDDLIYRQLSIKPINLDIDVKYMPTDLPHCKPRSLGHRGNTANVEVSDPLEFVICGRWIERRLVADFGVGQADAGWPGQLDLP